MQPSDWASGSTSPSFCSPPGRSATGRATCRAIRASCDASVARDLNSLAGVVRGHVAAKAAGLPFRIGCRLRLDDGSEWLAWPGSRAAHGRLTPLLSRGRMQAPKGECRISRAAMLAAAEGWVLAAIPPGRADVAEVAQLHRDAAALRHRLALPLLLTAAYSFRGADRHRLDVLARTNELAF